MERSHCARTAPRVLLTDGAMKPKSCCAGVQWVFCSCFAMQPFQSDLFYGSWRGLQNKLIFNCYSHDSYLTILNFEKLIWELGGIGFCIGCSAVMTFLPGLALKQKEKPSLLRNSCKVTMVILAVTAGWLVQCKTTLFYCEISLLVWPGRYQCKHLKQMIFELLRGYCVAFYHSPVIADI